VVNLNGATWVRSPLCYLEESVLLADYKLAVHIVNVPSKCKIV